MERMLALDLVTLSWVLLVTCLVLSSAVLIVNVGTHRGQGLSAWGWGLLLQALAYPAFALRFQGYPELSILLTNGLSSATIAVHTIAVSHFQRDQVRPSHPGWVWLPVLVIEAMAWIWLDDHRWRNVGGGLVLAFQSAWLAWLAWGPGVQHPRERGRLLLLAGSAVLCLSMLSRAVEIGLYTGWKPSESVPAAAQAFSYLVVLAVLLLNTTGFLLMQKERSERLLSDSERRYRKVIESANEGICILHDGRFAFVNNRFERMAGAGASALLGQSIFPFIDPQDRALAQNNHRRRMAGEADDLRYAVRVHTQAGERRWWEIGGVAIEWQGKPATLNFINDITQRKAMEEEIQRLAFLDPLTELPNRRLLVDRLEVAIQATQRSRQWGALLFVDLDRFKFVNDTYGHEAGDALLREVAYRLQSCTRASDTVARFGGDEFVVLAGELGGAAAQAQAHSERLAQKILSALQTPFELQVIDAGGVDQVIEHQISGSVGVALFSGLQPADAVIKAADDAMYTAKSAGRNGYRLAVCDAPTAAAASTLPSPSSIICP